VHDTYHFVLLDFGGKLKIGVAGYFAAALKFLAGAMKIIGLILKIL